MKALRHEPAFLFLQVLAIVFVAEAGVMRILPSLVPSWGSPSLRAIADSCLLTVVCGPLIWWTIIRPLRQLAATEQAKAEALEAATPEGIITFDQRGGVESFSLGAEQIFGFSAAEVVGGDLGTLIPWQFLARYRDGSTGAAGQRRLLAGTVKIPGRHKDGSELPLALSLNEVRLHGKLLYTVVVRNLVDRERDEMRAEQMAAVAQLGTSFAHRLRNPLTSIKMLVQSYCRRPEGEAFDRDDLRVMEDEVRRMEHAVQTFLDFARPQKPDCAPLALPPLVAEAIAEVEPRARRKNVVLRFMPPGEFFELRGDAQQLRQVVVHLLENAVDAAPREGVVEVEVRALQAAREQVELRVLDSGPGLPPDVASRLFQPFVTTKATGVGLGLAISRRVAEDHGGSLSASSRPEGGTCFCLRLPRVRSPLGDDGGKGVQG
jgi:PAS domain S-box-containing protein